MDSKEIETQEKFNRVSAHSPYNKMAFNRARQLCQFIRQNGCEATSFLDAGCREGFAMDSFKEFFPKARVVGVDLVPAFVKEAADSGEAYQGDIQNLDRFGGQEFQWTFCSHTLEHCPDTRKAIEELYRVTQFGVFLVVPLEDDKHFEDNESHHMKTEDPIEWLKLFQHPDWILTSAYLSPYLELIALLRRITR